MNMLLLCLGGMTVGAVGFLLGLGRPGTPENDDAVDGPLPPGRSLPMGETRHRRFSTGTVLAATLVALMTGLLTRWPVAALLAGLATGALPALLGSTSANRAVERVEAVAVWTELLRDTLAASAGLGQAIVATSELSPRSIRVSVVALAERLTSGVPMDDALRCFASEIDDPSADLVVCALLLAASSQSQKLADLLGALAMSCRDDVAMRLRVEASRASSRSGVRTVVVFSLAFAALLFALAHAYLAPFGTATGQLVLLVVGAFYATGLALMVRLVRPPAPVRLLHLSRHG
ncbi:MAG: type II secretion system F family protein [Acidimicrobiales bacterium]